MRPLLSVLLPVVASVWPLPTAQAANNTPSGCSASINSLYYKLCDLTAVWGIVMEALAAAGTVSALLLLLILLASLPFVTEGNSKRSSVGLQVGFLVFTLGLFGLTFAFIVGPNFATCASRRFLFGVLFAGCFACLMMQAVNANLLARQDRAARGWVLCLGALGLWLVEVIINTEWLIITVVRYPVSSNVGVVPCNIANKDFAMALIYVMVLLLATLVVAVPVLAGRHERWRMEGTFILLTSFLSMGIWVAWIVMYVYGNGVRGSAAWDDPTLAIALVANAWVFLVLHTIPQIWMLTSQDSAQTIYGDEVYPSRGVGYETILKEQTSQNIFVENKAFSMDEPYTAPKPVSPYSGYNGQMRSSVYQPTELALITKSMGNQMDLSYETVLPRANISSPSHNSSTSTIHTGDTGPGQFQGSNGNGLQTKW